MVSGAGKLAQVPSQVNAIRCLSGSLMAGVSWQVGRFRSGPGPCPCAPLIFCGHDRLLVSLFFICTIPFISADIIYVDQRQI